MNTTTLSSTVRPSVGRQPELPGTIRPLGLVSSLPYFGVPALLSVLAMYGVTPALVARGILPFYAQLIPNGLVLALLLAGAIAGYRHEGRPLTWAGIKDRFRLGRLTGHAWLWAIGGTVVMFIGYYGASAFGQWLIQNGLMPLPASLPAWFDPRVSTPYPVRFSQEAGGLQGNWLAWLLMTVSFLFNVAGEEAWWRGYILPRQELALGRLTWVVHGLLWALWHAWRWWDIGLLAGGLVLAYVVSRTKNNSLGIIMHIGTNIAGPIFVLLGVLGIGL